MKKKMTGRECARSEMERWSEEIAMKEGGEDIAGARALITKETLGAAMDAVGGAKRRASTEELESIVEATTKMWIDERLPIYRRMRARALAEIIKRKVEANQDATLESEPPATEPQWSLLLKTIKALMEQPPEVDEATRLQKEGELLEQLGELRYYRVWRNRDRGNN